MARTSTGTGITSMQMDLAFQDHILIPWRKREPEGFKSASQLLLSDKGGLTYTPKLGFHEEVGELDFASMYPSIMVKYNISPETINCRCCPDNWVPEIGHHLCKKRKGVIPRFLKPLLDKRTAYKQLMRETSDPQQKRIYDARQSALKWGLVTTFGYQGYKNARFGKIEARRSDTPVFIKRAQLEMVGILSTAKNRQDYQSLWPKLIDCFEGHRDKLRSGQVPFFDLAISKRLSKAPHEYQKASLIAIVANELAARGVRLMPGQTISYVITDEKSKIKSDRARALGFIDGACT